jgi:hypothetical protein
MQSAAFCSLIVSIPFVIPEEAVALNSFTEAFVGRFLAERGNVFLPLPLPLLRRCFLGATRNHMLVAFFCFVFATVKGCVVLDRSCVALRARAAIVTETMLFARAKIAITILRTRAVVILMVVLGRTRIVMLPIMTMVVLARAIGRLAVVINAVARYIAVTPGGPPGTVTATTISVAITTSAIATSTVASTVALSLTFVTAIISTS